MSLAGQAEPSKVPGHGLSEAAAGPDRGFTLLEVLVAFIIAALALGVLFQGGIGGLTTANAAARYDEALSRAQ